MGDTTFINTITISVSDFNQLHGTTQFSKLPLSIIDYFHGQRIVIDAGATVIKHFSKTEWYLIHKSQPFWQFFHFTVGKRARNNFPLTIQRETPDYNSKNVDPRIQEGIRFKDDTAPASYSLADQQRIGVNHKQQQKLAYFFTKEGNKTPFKHERTIFKIDAWGAAFYQKLTVAIAKVGTFVLLSLLLLLKLHYLLSLPVIGYAAYYFKNIFTEFKTHYGSNSIINQSLETLEKERQLLAAEADVPIVSDQQMEAWLSKELQTLDRDAFRFFKIKKETLLPLDKSVQGIFNGLAIQECGLVQPANTLGKNKIAEKNLKAFRFHGQQPLFGVYYMMFVYLTQEHICISSCFYDFIRGQQVGVQAKKYAYHDITRIEAQVENSLLQKGLGTLETNQVVLNFLDNSHLTIALTDALAIANLRTRIEGALPPDAPKEDLDKHVVPTKNMEVKKLLELPVFKLPTHRNVLLLTSLHHLWKQQQYYNLQNPIPSAALERVVVEAYRYV